jgi:toxin secretion/phage lysis holin
MMHVFISKNQNPQALLKTPQKGEKMEHIVKNIVESKMINVLTLIIVFDVILGILRAIKEKHFNSTIGINGGIRKIAMIISIGFLSGCDTLFSINAFNFLPTELSTNFPKLGLSAFFSLLFIVFEFVSVLKNMRNCGLPIPKKLKTKIENILNSFTDEL